jgi:hypoxanthine-DNA glycosylase
MSEYAHIVHPIPPLYDKRSRVLILGSFPSVKSREAMFFYGHPQNRYWRLMASLFGEDTPVTVPQKRAFALKNHIAMWDVIHSCDIAGSSDASIKNVVPNDVSAILSAADIREIYCNGGKAGKLYSIYIRPIIGRECIVLPSTSPANAGYTMARLAEAWRIVAETAKDDKSK